MRRQFYQWNLDFIVEADGAMAFWIELNGRSEVQTEKRTLL